ncbi:arginase [Ammoniphilus sp. 3BR4]|uniref:arginase n=1 Tax=Ammoniphilus sp. 3BR4 TaxID=3158265 RepID=UPI0034657ADF
MITTSKKIGLLQVEFDLGAGKRGASRGPGAVEYILRRYLNQSGVQVENYDALFLESEPGEVGNPKLKFLDQVVEINQKVAALVPAMLKKDQFPLILGGDHSIAIGTIAGLAAKYKNMGVIWFDAHADLNTAETSPSGNIHGMSLSASLGYGDPSLTELGGICPKIRPENVVIIGARQLDPQEKELIRSKGIKCYTMHEIDRYGMARVIEEAIQIVSANTDGVHLSFDVDSLDPAEAPGTGTPVRGGVNYREAHLALELMHESGIITSAEFVEVNPTLDKENRTSRLTVELIASLLGKRIL